MQVINDRPGKVEANVDRLHAADDRRKVMVQITRKGIELVNRLRNIIAENISDVMAAQAKGDDEVPPVYSQLGDFLRAN